ncbi:ribonuclease H-like domain-containing protein [Clostridium rectalis]|uniref:ribonuclease H-like domain-containing protein n=1 Tax=Clostridium rectalis TaxID=2040295 RepID=UPI000F634E82|nr:ribonuclease H-like domain-containing protein [Clostridium rectalis]
MFFKESEEEVYLSIDIFSKYNMQDIAYFDIETTGFDKENDKIILISLGHFLENGKFIVKQYFNETALQEEQILSRFCDDLNNMKIWCSYNGIAFDEPFIRERLTRNKIWTKLPSNHIDLYRHIRPYYKQLGINRCNLKSVEKYVGIERKDKIDGGLSIELYNEYIKTRDEKIKKKILLHNYEDVLNLPKIFNILNKIDNDKSIIREDAVTEKQVRFLNYLLKKNKIVLNNEVERISKRAASRMIDSILKGNKDVEELHNIMKNSY